MKAPSFTEDRVVKVRAYLTDEDFGYEHWRAAQFCAPDVPSRWGVLQLFDSKEARDAAVAEARRDPPNTTPADAGAGVPGLLAEMRAFTCYGSAVGCAAVRQFAQRLETAASRRSAPPALIDCPVCHGKPSCNHCERSAPPALENLITQWRAVARDRQGRDFPMRHQPVYLQCADELEACLAPPPGTAEVK